MEYEGGKLYRTSVNLDGAVLTALEEVIARMPYPKAGWRRRGVNRSTAIENAVSYYLRYLRSLEGDKVRNR